MTTHPLDNRMPMRMRANWTERERGECRLVNRFIFCLLWKERNAVPLKSATRKMLSLTLYASLNQRTQRLFNMRNASIM